MFNYFSIKSAMTAIFFVFNNNILYYIFEKFALILITFFPTKYVKSCKKAFP